MASYVHRNRWLVFDGYLLGKRAALFQVLLDDHLHDLLDVSARNDQPFTSLTAAHAAGYDNCAKVSRFLDSLGRSRE